MNFTLTKMDLTNKATSLTLQPSGDNSQIPAAPMSVTSSVPTPDNVTTAMSSVVASGSTTPGLTHTILLAQQLPQNQPPQLSLRPNIMAGRCY